MHLNPPNLISPRRINHPHSPVHIIPKRRRPTNAHHHTPHPLLILPPAPQTHRLPNRRIQHLLNLWPSRRQRQRRVLLQQQRPLLARGHRARVVYRHPHGGVYALLDQGYEERHEGPDRLGVLNRPNELDDLDAAPAFEVLLDEVLNDRERKRDTAPSRDQDGPREAGEQGVAGTACWCALLEKEKQEGMAHVLTVGPLDHDGDITSDPSLGVSTLLCHVKQPFRPRSTLLDDEHETLVAFADARDRERVDFGPAPPAHSGRQHTEADVLPRPPASVKVGHFDPGAVQIPEWTDDGGGYTCLEEPQEVVKTVDDIRSENVTGHGWLVQHDLLEK